MSTRKEFVMYRTFFDDYFPNAVVRVADASSCSCGEVAKAMKEVMEKASHEYNKKVKFSNFTHSIKTVYPNKKTGATVVLFTDGEKEIVKLSDGDSYDLGTAILYAYMKHFVFPSMTQFTKFVGSIENDIKLREDKKKKREQKKNKKATK